MFIQTEATPNPATLKFLPGRLVLESGTLDLPTKEAAARSPLAAKLFDVPNVSGVFFGSDFISVTKTDGDWQQMKPAILGAIMEHYMSGAELLSDDAKSDEALADEFFDAKDAETVATIKDLIETRVRPAVASDGGDITFRGYKEGIVYLNMWSKYGRCDLRPLRPSLRHARPVPGIHVSGLICNKGVDGRTIRATTVLNSKHARPCHRYRPRSLLSCGDRHRGRARAPRI